MINTIKNALGLGPKVDYKELLKITNYNTYNINYHIFTGDKVFANYPNTYIHPRYKNEQIISLLYENNIHSILFLNKFSSIQVLFIHN